ncbi:MAG: hypothetical protein HOC24_09785 [Deltaproteobacteria bacterium]|nr:hypothetical protein [Deltaproteobacteria bacterium]
MKFYKKNIVCLLFSIYLMVSCSKNNLVTINKSTAVSRKNAIIIYDVQWVDSFLNINTKKVRDVRSFELLSDEKLIKEHLQEIDGNRSAFNSPLYYLNNFQFSMENENGDFYNIVLFNRNITEYEQLAIFDITPGKYVVDKIAFNTYQYQKSQEYKVPDERWFRKNQSITGTFGQWKLDPGKIYYLGSYTFYFKTKRFNHGVFNRLVLNKSVKFMGLKREDKFEQTKSKLIETKPWLPVDGMVNLSGSLKWFNKIDEPLKFESQVVKPEKQSENKIMDKPEEERDTEKFFY